MKNCSVLVLVILSWASVATSHECYFGSTAETVVTGANDVVVVEQADGTRKATQLQIRVGKLSSFLSLFRSREGKLGKVYVNNFRVGSDLHLTEAGTVLFKR